MSVITEEQTTIVLTEDAAAQVRTLVEKRGRTDPALRLCGPPGGCASCESNSSAPESASSWKRRRPSWSATHPE